MQSFSAEDMTQMLADKKDDCDYQQAVREKDLICASAA